MMIVLDSIPSEQEDAVRALQDAMLAMIVNAEAKTRRGGRLRASQQSRHELQSAEEAYFAEVQEAVR